MTPKLLNFYENFFRILEKNFVIRTRIRANYLLFILLLLFGYLITFNLKSSFNNYLYQQTGSSLFDGLLSQKPFIYSVAQLLLFYLLCITVFTLLRMGTSKYMAVVLTFFFVTSSQVLIVFFSAPYYNLLSRIYVLLGIIVVLILVKTRVEILLEPTTVKLVKLILFFLLSILIFVIIQNSIIVSLIKYLFLGKPILSFISAIALFCLFILFYRIDLRKFLFRPTTEELIYLILTSFLLLLFLLDSISGQTRLFNIFFFIPFFCVTLITTFIIRARYKLMVFLVFILAVYFIWKIKSGLNTPVLFYPSTSYQNSSLMLLGTTQSPIQLAINFSDFSFLDFTEHLQLKAGNVRGYLSLMFSFFPHYLNILLINIKLIFQGTFINFDSIFIMPIFVQTIIDSLFKLFGTFSFLAGILSPFILIKRNRKQGLFLLVVFLVLLFLPLISRLSLHQYWFFPIFGLWSFGYLITVIYKDFLPKLFNLSFVSSSILTSKLSLHTLLSSSILTLMFFCSYFIDSGIKLLRDNFFSTNIQIRQVELYSQSYSALPRKTLNTSIFIGRDTGPNMKRILVKVPSETNLIEITTKEVCSLSNITVVLNSPNQEVPTRLRTNKISATQVYIPLIYKYPNSITTLEVLSFSNCDLDFFGIDTSNLKEPLFALIAPHFELGKVSRNSVFPDFYAENSFNLTFDKVRSAEFLISKKQSVAASSSFFGWLNTQGYKSTTDHRLFGRPMSELSAQVLGITDQGRFSSDLWRLGPITPKQEGSIWISGNVQRGTSIIGVTYGEKVLNSRQVPFALYELVGSVFSNESIDYYHCFPVYKNIKYTAFVGSIGDLYSPTLIKQSILGVKESNEPCQTNYGINNVWQHTL
jgi:hypothetical protein